MSDLTPRQPDAQPATGTGEPGLRASDADRERVVDILRQAGGDGRLDVDELDERVQRAYATKTIAELRPLIADLTSADAITAQPASGVTVRPGEGGTGTILSIMGGNDRKGRWRVAKHLKVINVMGGSDLDLNQAELSDRQVTITVFSLMGGSDIQVPSGVDVQVTKLGLMGGNDVELDNEPVPLGATVIRLRLVSIMGGTDVKQGPKLSRADRKHEKELRRAAERGELER